MKVTKEADGTVRLELQQQHEIDGLWVLAGHVGGACDTMRSMFSGVGQSGDGLCEKLEPFVSPVLCRPAHLDKVLPRSITEIVSDKYQQRVEGVLFFKPLDAPYYDDNEKAPLKSSSLQSPVLSVPDEGSSDSRP